MDKGEILKMSNELLETRRIFAAALFARKPDGTAMMVSAYLPAASTAEARGLALEQAQRAWPHEENWFDHHINLVEIPHAWLKRWMAIWGRLML